MIIHTYVIPKFTTWEVLKTTSQCSGRMVFKDYNGSTKMPYVVFIFANELPGWSREKGTREESRCTLGETRGISHRRFVTLLVDLVVDSANKVPGLRGSKIIWLRSGGGFQRCLNYFTNPPLHFNSWSFNSQPEDGLYQPSEIGGERHCFVFRITFVGGILKYRHFVIEQGPEKWPII